MLGIFDSGIGGLTVVRALLRRFPSISFLYLGDTARAPYGNKSAESIRRYAVEDARFLVERGVTDVIVACNTVSALAIDALHETFPNQRFFDVISPAVNEVCRSSWRRIGLVGTRATVGSGVYQSRILATQPKMKITAVPCPLLVPLVEEYWIRRPETVRIVRRYLAPIKRMQAEAIILGCTHYPLLEPVIRRVLQKRTAILDAPSALIRTMGEQTLAKFAATSPSSQTYFFSDCSPHTDFIASTWLERPIRGERAKID